MPWKNWKEDTRLTRRQRNICAALDSGMGVFSKSSFRISYKEYEELLGLGYTIQCESANGADRSDGLCYYWMRGHNR